MEVIDNPNNSEWSEILKRPTQTVNDIEATVNQIFDDVSENGDQAIKKYTLKFDGIALDSNSVSNAEIDKAIDNVPDELQRAIKTPTSFSERRM